MQPLQFEPKNSQALTTSRVGITRPSRLRYAPWDLPEPHWTSQAGAAMHHGHPHFLKKYPFLPSGGLICNRGHSSPKMPKRAQRAVLASLGPLGFVTPRGTCKNHIGPARPGSQCTMATLIFWKISIFAHCGLICNRCHLSPKMPKRAPRAVLASQDL